MIYERGMVTEMTAMEWVMVTEVIVLALLTVLLVCLVARSRRNDAGGRNNQQAMGKNQGWVHGSFAAGQQTYVNGNGYRNAFPVKPEQNAAYGTIYYGQSIYPQNSFDNTVYGQGTLPVRQGPNMSANFGVYGNQGYYGNNMNAGDQAYNMPQGTVNPGYGSGYIASPVIGEERTVLVNYPGRNSSSVHKNRNRAERNAQKSQSAGSQKKLEKPDIVQNGTSNEYPHHRWRVDFMEMSSGRQVSRDFRDELIVGRQMPAPMESGRLYLSMDATVSRAQFCLFATENGIMIENLSNINVTRKNGYPLWQPVLLEEGDILEMGRMRYMVKGIHPAA